VTLVGLDASPVAGRARLRLRALWRPGRSARPEIVSTSIDGVMLEAHELGGGTLGAMTMRAIREAGRVIVDEYDVVLPSTLAPAPHALTVGTVELGPGNVTLRASAAVPFVVE
jgi:hypothetical protein